jgi:hypothetical protein
MVDAMGLSVGLRGLDAVLGVGATLDDVRV